MLNLGSQFWLPNSLSHGHIFTILIQIRMQIATDQAVKLITEGHNEISWTLNIKVIVWFALQLN